MYALHGQMINVGRDLGKIIMRPFLMLVTNLAYTHDVTNINDIFQ